MLLSVVVFSHGAAPPTITSVSPNPIDAGGLSFLLIVNGSGFVDGAAITWLPQTPAATLLGKMTFLSSTQLRAEVTTDLRTTEGAYTLNVTNPGGAVSNLYALTISPVILTVTPSDGVAGSTITAKGIGFTQKIQLVLNASGHRTVLPTAFVDTRTLTAVIPATALSAAGSIQAFDPIDNIASATSVQVDIRAMPVITAASPTAFDAGGAGFYLTVNGTGFTPDSLVNWSGAALGTTFLSSTQLQAAITSELRSLSGTFNLTVGDPIGAASTPYPVTVSPVLFTIGPTAAAAGGPAVTITATGIGFTRNNVLALTVKGQLSSLATTYVKSTTLSAIVPAAALHIPGVASVQVVDSAGPGRSLAQPFTISELVPKVTGISPTAATAGAQAFTLTVNGANFVAGGTVLWNGLPLVTAFVTATQLTALAPATLIQSAGVATIAASNPGGTASSSSVTFTISPAAPVITSLSPNIATAGGPAFSLTVNGTSFVAATTVLWNGSPLVTAFVSSSKLVANVPASLIADGQSAAVGVGSPGGAVSGNLAFSIDPAHPTIGALSPASATAGAASFTLTVTGSSFAVNCVLRWNGTPLDTTFVSGTQVTATVPASTIAAGGASIVTLINPSGLTSNAAAFAVNTPVPAISGITPASAPAGGPAFTLTVNGANFLRTSTVLWNGAPLATVLVTGAQLTAAVPAALPGTSATAGVRVSTPGAADSNSAVFTIGPAALTIPPPATTSAGIVNAASGLPSIAPGSLISIYGTNLAPGNASATGVPLPVSLNGTAVTVNGSPAPLFFVSPLQINAQVPFETKTGTATLMVQSGTIKSTAVTFQVIETAPGVLTLTQSNHAIAQNDPEGTLNSPGSPARPGQYVTVYLTGQGQVDNPVATGAAGPATPFSAPLAPIQAQVGGIPAVIAFAGLAPGLVGLLQMNIVIPDVASGEQPFDVSIGGVMANRTVLSVRADR